MMIAAPDAALADRPLEGPDAMGVESGQGLVKQDGDRIVQVGSADRQLLLHAARQVADWRLLFLVQLEFAQQLRDLRVGMLDLVGCRGKGHVLCYSQVVKQLWIIRDVGQSPLGHQWRSLDLESRNRQLPPAGWQNTRQRSQGRGLARSVGANQPHDLAGPDTKIQALDGHSLVIRLVKILHRDQGYRPPQTNDGPAAPCRL